MVDVDAHHAIVSIKDTPDAVAVLVGGVVGDGLRPGGPGRGIVVAGLVAGQRVHRNLGGLGFALGVGGVADLPGDESPSFLQFLGKLVQGRRIESFECIIFHFGDDLLWVGRPGPSQLPPRNCMGMRWDWSERKRQVVAEKWGASPRLGVSALHYLPSSCGSLSSMRWRLSVRPDQNDYTGVRGFAPASPATASSQRVGSGGGSAM